MRRLTARAAGTPGYRVDGGTISPEAGAGGFVGEAIDRLGAFETLWEDLLRRQRDISDRLDALRRDGILFIYSIEGRDPVCNCISTIGATNRFITRSIHKLRISSSAERCTRTILCRPSARSRRTCASVSSPPSGHMTSWSARDSSTRWRARGASWPRATRSCCGRRISRKLKNICKAALLWRRPAT